MIPIAKGKFSQPRQPRRDNENIPAYVPPIPEPVNPPVPDKSLDETILLTTAFEPVKDPQAPVQPPVSNPMEQTMTFEEAEFIQQTTVYNTEAPKVHPKLQEDNYNYEQELRYRKQEAARKKSRNRTILIVSICIVTLLLLAAIIAGVTIFINSNKDDGKILNNVTVAGVNIGGMTPEEAAAAIHRATDMSYTVENMVIYLPDTILELSPKDTNAKLDVEAAVEAAYNYGRTGTEEENKKAKADSLLSNHTIALLPYLNLNTDYIRDQLVSYGEAFNSDFEESSWELEGEMPELDPEKFDEKAEPQILVLNPGKPGRHVDVDKIYNDVLDAYSLNQFVVRTEMTDKEQIPEALDLEELFEMLCTESEDASMDMETFEVTPEVYGYTFDLEYAKELLAAAEPGTVVRVPMEYVEPELVAADFFADELSSYQTKHTNKGAANENILNIKC
mgnify:CR=1 FL=1